MKCSKLRPPLCPESTWVQRPTGVGSAATSHGRCIDLLKFNQAFQALYTISPYKRCYKRQRLKYFFIRLSFHTNIDCLHFQAMYCCRNFPLIKRIILYKRCSAFGMPNTLKYKNVCMKGEYGFFRGWSRLGLKASW